MDLREKLLEVARILGKEELESNMELEQVVEYLRVRAKKVVDEIESYREQLEASALLLESHVEELSKTYEELSTIFKITSIASRSLDPSEVIEEIMNELNGAIEARVALFIDKDGRRFFELGEEKHVEAYARYLTRYYLADECSTLVAENVKIDGVVFSNVLIVPVKGSRATWGVMGFAEKSNSPIFTASDRKLVEAVAQRLASSYDIKAFIDEKIRQERLMEEMRIAGQIQLSLLPKEIPRVEFLEMDVFFKTARIVGGDFYDVVEPFKGKVFFVLADVSGKSVPAALLMSLAKGAIRAKTAVKPNDVHECNLVDLASYLNSFILENSPVDRFITCVMGCVSQDGGVRMVNAGHDPVFVLRTDGSWEEYPAVAQPLGIMDIFDAEETRLHLQPGDLVVLFTDGVVETRNVEKEEYGFDRLKRVVFQNRNKSVDEIIEDLRNDIINFSRGADQHDDITLLMMRYTGGGA